MHTRKRGVAIKLACQRERSVANQACTLERGVAIQACTPERGEAIKFAHQTEWRQQAASAVCCGDINAIPEYSESLRRPIRQED